MAEDKKVEAEQKKPEDAKVEDTNTETEAQKEEVNLSDNAKKVMELVENMTVLELSDLVKALEDKFGVSAAAPMMVAGAVAGGATGGGEEATEEKSAYDVVLKSAGDQKIAVIKVIRELDQSLGLVDAKNLAETADAVILEGAKKEEAEEAKKKLEEAGATVELK